MRVLVTGTSGSIGAAIIRVFLGAGHSVTGAYRTMSDQLEPLVDSGEFTGVEIDFKADASEWALPDEVDVLVSSAGVGSRAGLLEDVTLEDLRDVMRVNLETPFLLAQRFVPGMVERGFGRVIHVNSIWGLRGTDASIPYVVSKHGLSGFTRACANDFAHTGVTFNDVCPTAVDSRLMSSIAQRVAGSAGDFTELLGRWRLGHLGGRFVTPSEVAAAVAFLASPHASGVNGVSIPVDMGRIC